MKESKEDRRRDESQKETETETETEEKDKGKGRHATTRKTGPRTAASRLSQAASPILQQEQEQEQGLASHRRTLTRLRIELNHKEQERCYSRLGGIRMSVSSRRRPWRRRCEKCTLVALPV